MPRKAIHGHTRKGHRHPIYRSWEAMIRRCTKEKSNDYDRYGGRGIKVYPDWLSYEVFLEWAKISGWRAGLTLERINVNGNYEPSNCSWATRKQQANNKRDTHWIEVYGRMVTIEEALKATGNIVNHKLALQRLTRGWAVMKALTTPKLRIVKEGTWVKATI